MARLPTRRQRWSAAPVIVEAYVPEQEAEVDYFHIPPSGMMALMAHLRERRLGLAAQVHSHPARAFHSLADDKWAIVRHEGAMSRSAVPRDHGQPRP